jgi:hypothetical protein
MSEYFYIKNLLKGKFTSFDEIKKLIDRLEVLVPFQNMQRIIDCTTKMNSDKSYYTYREEPIIIDNFTRWLHTKG